MKLSKSEVMDLITFILWLIVFWILVWFMREASKYMEKNGLNVPVRDSSKGHHWLYIEAFPAGKYCNVCETSTFHGGLCDYCGIIADDSCIKKANSAVACKSLANMGSMKHHWVCGNLPQRSVCVVCEEYCGHGPGLQDFRCCWCQSTLHHACLDSYSSICDFGPFKKMIIPPNCVKLKAVGWKGRRHFVVKEVLVPKIESWSPVIVVGNRLSGNGEGSVVLQAFRKILNPIQVLDLAEVKPEAGLEWCHLLPNIQCRVLIAGGDGTVGWILSTIENLGLQPPPLVGLVPLGTGNDLSRSLGWGAGHTGGVDAAEVLKIMSDSRPAFLDRWTVAIKHQRHFGLKRPDKTLTMSNYMSIGVDALVTYNFHNKRSKLPRVMSGRLMNKMLFFHYGTKDLLERGCTVMKVAGQPTSGLEKQLELRMDGKKVDLPELEGILILNINSWGAGVKPWELCWCSQDHSKQSYNDGRVEVVGLLSSFHIAQMQVGLSEPHRFGQASEVEIRFRKDFHENLPMQVDGEPWLQKKANIRVSLKGQASVLTNPYSTPPLISPTHDGPGTVSFY